MRTVSGPPTARRPVGLTRSKIAAAVGLCSLAVACSAPTEFAEWTVPVVEGTEIIEYTHVPTAERTAWIEIERDLTIGGRSDDTFLYRPQAIAADDAGRIYVADGGEHEVKVFDNSGGHVRSFGHEGQGPAEFIGPVNVAIAGTTIVVVDPNKLSLWNLGGKHLMDIGLQRLTPTDIVGLADGNVLVSYPAVDEAARRQLAKVETWDATAGERAAGFPTLLTPESLYYPSATAERRRSIFTGQSWPRIAADPLGDVYLTQSDEYQILAFKADGAPRWALRVAMPQPPLYPRDVERTMESIHESFPEATERSVAWPSASSAIDTMWVDGHGRLYVLPYFPAELEATKRNVDVYSAEGERLFAGRMVLPAGAWTQQYSAHRDHMFFLDQDRDSGEWQVVRYRVTEPFAP